ncbi:hypothetical protein CN692_15725 [Bacillus sp. AFS002410]|uniref:hypothetical protein n=1 Tax=Bacillus sp. AFS002410 TaxID=2033481 RepID=UPI000BF22807|nr:hypothetical protein [Bacillus sp. AFS002410]PEJ56783.1 hypothetical protein CN692_15725 [Bacillus sp. AFS002410]
MVKFCFILGGICLLLSGVFIGAFQSPDQQRVVKEDFLKLGHFNKFKFSVWTGIIGVFFIGVGTLVYYI